MKVNDAVSGVINTKLLYASFILVLLLQLITLNSFAQYTKLLDFTGAATGSEPTYTRLTCDGTSLYGMTSAGGVNARGVVFKITADGTSFTKLRDFGLAPDGDSPFGSLYNDGTFLYGMTVGGGSNSNNGTIFKIKPDGTGYLKIYNFSNDPPYTGTNPRGSIISDGTYLYGMTTFGGVNGSGTVFKILLDGTGFSKLHDFAANSGSPHGDLILIGTTLYGMTIYGGPTDKGTLFKIETNGTGFNSLREFVSPDGVIPFSGALVYDGTYLYGMTQYGGTTDDGTIFKIKPDGTGYENLHNFSLPSGTIPLGALELVGSTLYGLTYQGGSVGLGTLFKINTDGSGYQTLMEFDGIINGYDALGTLCYCNNALYGMTNAGGTNNLGTIFKYSLAPPVPTIANFTPANGPVGTTVTITGTNFSATPASNIVFFGATKAAVTVATATQLTVTVPTGSTFKPITVSVNGLTAQASKPFVVTFAGGTALDNCSFAPPLTIGTVSYSYTPTLCDLDGDGKIDLLIPELSNNQLAIFRNTSVSGTPSFAANMPFTGLTEALATATGDLDGDGKPDIAVANYTNGQLSVYKNLSTPGTISVATRVIYTIPAFTDEVSIADIDGDGKLDLIITASIQGLIVMRNQGLPGVIDASTFAAGVTFATGPNAYPVALGDIDGDGKLDAVVPNANTYTLSVLLNTSTPGTVSFATSVTLTTNTGTPTAGYGTGYVSLGDIDGDSKMDIVAVSNTVTKLSLFRNISTPGSLAFDPRFDIATAGIGLVPPLSDLNGDGKLDLVADNGPLQMLVFENTATSGVIDASSFKTPVVLTRASSAIPQLGDVDGDGRNDIISTSTNLQVFRNLVGTISPPTITSFTPSSGAIGTSVTITGTNFSTPFSNTVEFNGVPATNTGSTATTLTVTVPVGASSGPLDVTIGCNTVTSASNFTISQNFITQWNLATGGSGATQLSFGTATSGTVNYTWQEISPGSATGSGTWSGATLTITSLPAGATIRLQIAPTNFQRIINGGGDRFRLTQVENWGSTAWSSMQNAFIDCSNLQVTATDVPNLLGVTNMSQMFRGCTNLNSPSNIGSWNTGAVTNMSSMFSGASAFNQNIGSWDTGAVTNMSRMFSGASAFNNGGNGSINNWNTGAVTNMIEMFRDAWVFNQNIGSWNTASVTNMTYMFAEASAFNQNIGAWNTGAVTDMAYMFYVASAFNNGGNGAINNWNTGAVTDMNNMFNRAATFNQNIGSWNTGAVTSMYYMFLFASAFNQNIGSWNTGAVINMFAMFNYAIVFNQNIGSWNTAAVTDMREMFSQASAFNNGGNGSINNWNTGAVTNMRDMFNGASAFNQNIDSWNTATVTDMLGMFSGASAFNQNIGSWNTGAVTNMYGMFNRASAFNQNIGAWNTGAVTNMYQMFEYASAFNNGGNGSINNWNTGAVVTMYGMFREASAFNQNIGAWNTGAVTSMFSMFKGASAFNQNIGSWNTGAVTDMGTMFNYASAFNQNIGSWNTAAVTSMERMFWQASAFNQNIGTWTLNSGVDLSIMLDNSGMDCNNYSANLMGWSANPSTPNGRSLGATGRQYGTNAVAARTNLTVTKGWTIGGDTPSGAVCVVPNNNFVTVWNLATAGSGTTQLSFGTATSGVVNYTWQEISPGSATGSGSWSGSTLTITGLPTGATIRLQIAPTNFQRIINNGTDRSRLTLIENWGSTVWTSMQEAFAGCTNLQVTATDVPDLSGVSNMTQMFSGCTNLNSPGNINTWNTAAVTNMSGMFRQASAFNQDIGSWNTSAVTSMNQMFLTASAFNNGGNGSINNWNTGAVTNMENMFNEASVFNQSIGSWNTGAVTNISQMFVSAFAFNQNIGAWNTTAVTNMSRMFFSAITFNQNIGSWNTGAVTNMEGMFYGASVFNQNIGAWNTTAVTNMQQMFFSAIAFNQNIGSWNTGAVTRMSEMFQGANAFNQNIDSWNTGAVTSMFLMFFQASAFNQNIGAWTLNPGVIMNQMLDGTGMDCNNYSATLIGWSANPSTPNGRTLGATGIQYGSLAVSARANLVGVKGWAIFGDALSSSVAPSITTFAPTLGAIGTTITITGTNFSTTPASNLVTFNGVTATVTASTTTSITTSVPAGATTGAIGITVGCNSILSGSNFTVSIPIPTIVNFTPASGPIGTTITITGTNFDPAPANNIVKFNGTTAVATASSSTSITTTVPIGATTGTITVTVGSNTATSATSFTVTTCPLAPTAGDNQGCQNTSVTLSASGGAAGQYRWYNVATGGTAIAGEVNSSYSTPSLTTTTTYFVAINDGICESPRTSVIATINIPPSAPTTTGGSSCGTGIVTLTASGATNGQYRWYTVATGGAAIAVEVNSAYTTPSVSTTTTYYVSINNGTCESARTSVIATINTPPSAPTATGGSSCGTGVVTLAASGGTNGQYRWYTVATGGTALTGQVNSSFTTPSISATTTYYVSINNGTCESARTSVVATIDSTITAPTTTNSSLCGPGVVTLNSSGGTNGQYRWYTLATGGAALTGEVNSSYVTPSISTTTTYYVAINNGTCESLRSPAVASINPVPAKPIVTTSGSTSLCPGQSVTLSAPVGFTYSWSTGATSQQIIVSTAGSFTVQITSVGCTSVSSDPIVVSIGVCNQPPVIAATTVQAEVEGLVTLKLTSLLSDPDNNLDLSTLRIIQQPASGAPASINSNNELTINYQGLSFAGIDELIIEVCDLSGECVQQKITIEVIGDIIVYNAISPNDDNKNPAFILKYIDAIEQTKNNKVSIFNRWGDLVWEGVNYNNASVVFTGTNKNGNELPSGTYFYKIEFASGRKTDSGYLSLKR